MGNTYNIRLPHWLAAITLAFLLHALLAVQLDHTAVNSSSNTDSQNIKISLKKLTSPVDEVEPVVQETIQAPQAKPNPLPIKPQSKPKQQATLEKNKPIVKMPDIEPLPTEVKPEDIPEIPQPPSKYIQNKKLVTNSQTISIPVEKKVNDSSQIRNDYLVRLSVWLAKHKRYPPIARRRKQEDTVKVSFVIDANGNLIRYQIIRASKFSSLNKAAASLLEKASPMPAVPVAIRMGKREFEYTIPIEYKLVDD